jgi:signal transduction histidine kinase
MRHIPIKIDQIFNTRCHPQVVFEFNALLMQVSDEGGGIRRSGLPRIFTYLYSTAKNPPDIEGPSEGVTMAGYGFGLPVSRLYARYFGGDLQIISMEGYGMLLFCLSYCYSFSMNLEPILMFIFCQKYILMFNWSFK